MEETGTVIEIKDNIAIIKMAISENCKNCCACNFSSDKELTIEATNSLGAKKDDKVKILIPEKAVFYASFVIYIIPLIGLFAGYFIGTYMTNNFFDKNYSEIIGILSSALGFFGTFFLIYRYEKKFKSDNKMMPDVIEIVK
ncbi:SoxR reducing system RseC family protein [Candidatus Poribacteria bacterium]|nr:SoxR reducing system RseC family protein [Candidatus Poribacteria bacterium]